MARFSKKSLSEIGDSPYELKFKGKRKSDTILLRVIDFDADNFDEYTLHKLEDIEKHLDTETVTWLNVDGLHEPEVIKKIGDIFHLDRKLVSDVLNTNQRPNTTEYDDYIFMSLKMLQYDELENVLHTENLSLVMAKNLLITFQEKRGDVFEPVRERLRKQKKKIRSSGTDYLAFALLDIVIDNYIYIISLMGEKIEALEDELLENPSKKMLEQINDFKREIHYLRKHIAPAKEMINSLVKMDSDLIDDEVESLHWKELQDNLSQATDSTETYREILSDMMNIYHTTLTTKLNDIMKFLTIFSVIFIPLTFIAGIYGTNFDNLPELHYQYSYYVMWGVMISITIGMIFYFRSRDWF